MNPKKKPLFNRTDANKGKKFGSRWNKPRGLQNKLRMKIKSHGSRPSPGYGAPKKLKNLVKNGMKLVMVFGVEQLSGVNVKSEIIILDGRIGTKKKIDLLERICKLNVSIYNVKDVKSYLDSLKNKFEEKKKKKISLSKAKMKKSVVKKDKTEEKKVMSEVKKDSNVETKMEKKK